MKRALSIALLVSGFAVMSGCVPENGTASFHPITADQFQEALTNEQTRTR